MGGLRLLPWPWRLVATMALPWTVQSRARADRTSSRKPAQAAVRVRENGQAKAVLGQVQVGPTPDRAAWVEGKEGNPVLQGMAAMPKGLARPALRTVLSGSMTRIIPRILM